MFGRPQILKSMQGAGTSANCTVLIEIWNIADLSMLSKSIPDYAILFSLLDEENMNLMWKVSQVGERFYINLSILLEWMFSWAEHGSVLWLRLSWHHAVLCRVMINFRYEAVRGGMSVSVGYLPSSLSCTSSLALMKDKNILLAPPFWSLIHFFIII